MWRERNNVPARRLHALGCMALASALLPLPARLASAATCNVVIHPPATDADKALLGANFAQAESLYQAALAANPGNVELTAGLVRALLRDQKVQEAADTVKAALVAAPASASFIELRGEVEYRQGEPWAAGKSAAEAFKLDPCNPRTHLLLANLLRIQSFYATAQKSILTAHQLDPGDPEIQREWMATLPLRQRIAELELYLAAPRGDNADELHHLQQALDHMKKLAAEPRRPCRLVSPIASTRLPIVDIMRDATHVVALGLDVKLNGHSSRLQIDTGAGGLLISRAAARRAGLQSFSRGEVAGIGDEGLEKSYTAFADSLRIGDLEFQNCAVEVVDAASMPGEIDGLIGADVFSQFLVTLDFPVREVLLGPLPPRPGQDAAATAKLDTDAEDEDDAGQDAQSSAPPAASASVTASAPRLSAHGPFDRYIAPEMKDYTQVYRVGHLLLLPTQLNDTKLTLFVLDTGMFATTISPQAAGEVTKVYGDSPFRVQGVNGEVNKVYSASEINFHFANISQKVEDALSFDTSKISKDAGLEISGLLGATTLRQLTIHIDYRDGLVKFEYNANRGYKF